MVVVELAVASSSLNVKECIATLWFNMLEKGKPNGFPFLYLTE